LFGRQAHHRLSGHHLAALHGGRRRHDACLRGDQAQHAARRHQHAANRFLARKALSRCENDQRQHQQHEKHRGSRLPWAARQHDRTVELLTLVIDGLAAEQIGHG
jgi:hypothetical protein